MQKIDWSKHELYENPTQSRTFTALIACVAEYFDLEVYHTRLNYYADGKKWKPYHHDSHAYGGKALREDFTVGLSFGGTRELSFLHEPSGRTFAFPQANGSCFAFTNDVNQRFMHGVPHTTKPVQERFSIIAWGRRQKLTLRNGGMPSSAGVRVPRPLGNKGEEETPLSMGEALDAAYDMVRVPAHQIALPLTVPAAGEAQPTRDAMPLKKKKNRLQ